MSARKGESSKASSFQTIFGINSEPGDFFTFKARRVLYTVRLETYRCAGTGPNTGERGSKGRKWAVRLPRNLLNFSASVASSGILLPISWADQSPERERPRNSLMSLHHREIFESCRPDFVLIKTFPRFRARFLDSIPKLLVNVRSLPPFREGFLALAIRSFKLRWSTVCRLPRFQLSWMEKMCQQPSSDNCVVSQTSPAPPRCLKLLTSHKLLSMPQSPVNDWPWCHAIFWI